MEISQIYKPTNRISWRSWLEINNRSINEIWLIYDDRPGKATITYLDAVEEAICFGWIDGIEKRISSDERAQRFSPRKKRSNWTELNKERARRLIRLGLMTPAGKEMLPDLELQISIAEDIVTALKTQAGAWENYLAFPELYQRVRIGYIEEMRKNQIEFERRLNNFVKRTSANQMFGNWNDGGRLL